MPHHIVKIGDRYCEWSTVIDAPVTSLVVLSEFRRWYRKEYGDSSMEDFKTRVARAKKTGTSAIGTDLKSLLSCNRAGPGEAYLTVEEIKERYEWPKKKLRGKK